MTRSILGFFPSRQTVPVAGDHLSHGNHPGEGRGPMAKVDVMMRNAPSAASPNWAPASAGVVTER